MDGRKVGEDPLCKSSHGRRERGGGLSSRVVISEPRCMCGRWRPWLLAGVAQFESRVQCKGKRGASIEKQSKIDHRFVSARSIYTATVAISRRSLLDLGICNGRTASVPPKP